MAGIYIHIPFCAQFCTYCDFYSSTNLKLYEQFVAALIKEIESRDKSVEQQGLLFETLYLGGGTPSLLPIELLDKIVKRIKTLYPTNLKEVTIELNPEDITPHYAAQLLSIGFNRASLGVQSFNTSHLKWMNRRHTAERSLEAFTTLRQEGFNNISIDLIYGFTPLTDREWEHNLNVAVELAPEHISAYQLNIEPETPLFQNVQKGIYTPSSGEFSYNQYSMLLKLLAKGGYHQYEISSFSQPKKESLHNSNYWNFIPYFGFGPSAHSFYNTTREWNYPGIEQYIEGWRSGKRLFGSEILSNEERFNEFIMLSLGKVVGIDIDWLEEHYLNSSLLSSTQVREFKEALKRLIDTGAILKERRSYKIAPSKLFISDSIIAKLLLLP